MKSPLKTTLLYVLAWICCVGVTGVGSAQDDLSFDSVQAFLDASVDDEKIAGGSVIIFHAGKTVFQTGFGYADIESQSPFEVDTPAIIASISKPLLGTTMFHLAQSDRVDLSAPITDYLPEFSDCKLADSTALIRPPKVGELLTHTSGMRNDQANNGRIWFQEWTRGKTIEEVVKKIASDIPFVRQPDTKFAYSGIGTEVLARVGEVTTGLSRNALLRKHLCEPLEMSNTFYRDQGGLKRHGVQMPTRYHRDKEKKSEGPSGEEGIQEEQPAKEKLSIYKGRPVAQTDRYSSSGGTVISTAPDLLKWLRMIRRANMGTDNTYLARSTVAEMLEGNRIGKIARGGLFVRARDKNEKPITYGHTGSSGTNVWIDFETDTIGIMLTQTTGADIKPFRIELEKKVMATIRKAIYRSSESR